MIVAAQPSVKNDWSQVNTQTGSYESPARAAPFSDGRYIYIQKGLGLDINGCPNWPLGAYAPVYGVY